MGQYQRLTLMEREELSRMLAAGYKSACHGSGSPAGTAHALACTRPAPRLPGDVPRRAGSSTGSALGPSPTQASKVNRPAAVAHLGPQPARPALVARTDCPRLAPAVS